MGLTVACVARLHKNQLERHLELFDHVPEVERVILVRPEPIDRRMKKLDQRPVGTAPLPVLLGKMAGALDRVIRCERPDCVIGFNPVPWASLASEIARRHGVPASICMLGSDYNQLQAPWAFPFRTAVRRASLVTVTGQSMLEGAQRLGVARRKLRILPHSVDTERFSPGHGEPDFDVISVGRLVPLKRMDVLIDAVALLKRQGLHLRVGIVGDGPLRSLLQARAAHADVADSVEFLGFQEHVEDLLRRARVFALLSESEGMPFALMEALAAELVPVVTDVGTISDWVEDGHSGRFVRVGDVEDVAQVLGELFRDHERMVRLRRGVEAKRPLLGFDHGVSFWQKALLEDLLE